VTGPRQPGLGNLTRLEIKQWQHEQGLDI